MTRQTIWHYFQRNRSMFQFLTHVELSRSMAAILEMPQYVAYQKNVAFALFTLSTKSHTFNRYCTIMPFFLALAALLYVTHIIVIFCCTLHFVLLNQLQLNTDFPIFAFFTVKLPSVTKRSVSQENALQIAITYHFFFCKTIGSNNSFTLIENNFRFLR